MFFNDFAMFLLLLVQMLLIKKDFLQREKSHEKLFAGNVVWSILKMNLSDRLWLLDFPKGEISREVFSSNFIKQSVK